MQAVSDQFEAHATGNMRPITHRVFMSFDKAFDPTVDFFTIGVSSIGGIDIIAGIGEVVQEWDKYEYTDYSNRVIAIEWTHQQQNPYSASLGMADVTFDNHDDFFTPGSGSAIDDDVLPQRPIRIHAGFDNEVVQVFVGVTEGMPEIDEKAKTATFHCVDFLYTLYNRPLDEEVIYQDMRVDEVIGSLLESAGLTPSQYEFDQAITTIPFAYFSKGMKLGDAVDKLVQADLGYLYMDENGVITYKNRQNFSDVSVYDFDPSNTNDSVMRKQDDIINVVEVKSSARSVQESQKIWESSDAVYVAAGDSTEIWADFSDPVTTVDDPIYIDSATTSFYAAHTTEDATEGTDFTDFTLDSTDLFSVSMKMTFTNDGTTGAYLTKVVLHGTPAKVVSEIYVRKEDAASVASFDEKLLTIDNEYIQDESTAESLALTTLGIYSSFGGALEIDVKGTPALQVRDPITVDGEDYFIRKQENHMVGGSYTQKLTVEKRTILDYFTIGVSSIGGYDVIAA